MIKAILLTDRNFCRDMILWNNSWEKNEGEPTLLMELLSLTGPNIKGGTIPEKLLQLIIRSKCKFANSGLKM